MAVNMSDVNRQIKEYSDTLEKLKGDRKHYPRGSRRDEIETDIRELEGKIPKLREQYEALKQEDVLKKFEDALREEMAERMNAKREELNNAKK